VWVLQVHPQDVAAIILEPVLGEGGFLTPPPGFMSALRQLADKHGIMLIADEVRRARACTGTARAGGRGASVCYFGLGELSGCARLSRCYLPCTPCML
jgi:adenosylmethionine-8-amino-7-oxononanoate aminotransferase